MVGEITKLKYEDLVFFMSDNGRADAIPKTMIFIDDIEDKQRITAYLSSNFYPGFKTNGERSSTPFYLTYSLSHKPIFLETFKWVTRGYKYVQNVLVWVSTCMIFCI